MILCALNADGSHVQSFPALLIYIIICFIYLCIYSILVLILLYDVVVVATNHKNRQFFKNSVHPQTICGDIYGAIWWALLLQCIGGLVSGWLCKGKVWIRGAGQIKWNKGAFYISRIVWKQGDQQARSPGLPDETWVGAWEGEVFIAGRWDFSVENWEAFH